MDSSLTEGPSGEIVHGVPNYKLQCNSSSLKSSYYLKQDANIIKITRDRNTD